MCSAQAGCSLTYPAQAGGQGRSSLLEQSRAAEATGDCIAAVDKLHHHHDVKAPSGTALLQSCTAVLVSIVLLHV